MNNFYYILYDLDSVRKVKPIKIQLCYSRTDKNVIIAFNTLLDIM
uniref:Uncharacterized protein n=1 Tax=viral metagenome TaxID=1070528 RepID=A0A6C0CFV7_9ZZZZ